MKKSTLLLDALASKPVERAPVWLMRQAGRYLPEYRDLRKKCSLGRLFHEPELAAEVTLMPLARFPLDAAIVFSDLLVLLEVWGKSVTYPETGGLRIEPRVESSIEIFSVSKEEIEDKLSYMFNTLKLVKPKLSVPLLGFSGAPFTLLCYLLEGKGGSYDRVRFFLKNKKEEVLQMLDNICQAIISYMQLQISAGAEALQVFDSWTHILTEEEFKTYALPYWQKIQATVTEVPLIFFSRSNSQYPESIASIIPSAISFDEGASLASLRKIIPSGIAVQGNYCPRALAEKSAKQVYEEALFMARSVSHEKGVILNLGHGVLPGTPLENVTAFLDAVRLKG